MDRKRPRQREDWIELTDDDLEEPTIAEFNPVPTPTVSMGICSQCGGPCAIAGPMDLAGGFPAACLRSPTPRRWFWCAGKRLLGCYVP